MNGLDKAFEIVAGLEITEVHFWLKLNPGEYLLTEHQLADLFFDKLQDYYLPVEPDYFNFAVSLSWECRGGHH